MPHVRARAERLFERDEVFGELCDEYQACSETTNRLAVTAGADKELLREYEVLRLRLEAELLRYVAEHPDA